MRYGFVYLLGNRAMPGLFKLGCTERSPHARAADLSRHTGVPQPFDVLAYVEVSDHQRVEHQFHLKLDAFRHGPQREFFHFARDLPWAAGHFKFYPTKFAYVECDLAVYLFEHGDSMDGVADPWGQASPFDAVDFSGTSL